MKQVLIHNKEEKGLSDTFFWPEYLEDETEEAAGTDQERFDNHFKTEGE